ncbi:hypothetical protein AAFC00_002077 [Neodothiora populina]|uniref:Uncharacterized protein n=1 Tax=Neodothiora populina TaxID=2781224 RepID=A0ABR3PGN7_9PEZI
MSANPIRPIAHPTPRLKSNGTLRQQYQHQPGGGGGGSGPPAQGYRAASEEETVQDRHQRNQAASILANYEQLVWLAMARNESIVQTRLYYEAILAGLPTTDPDVEWPTEYQSASKDAQGRSPAGKGKARAVGEGSSKHKNAGEGGSSSSAKKRDRDRGSGRRSLGA